MPDAKHHAMRLQPHALHASGPNFGKRSQKQPAAGEQLSLFPDLVQQDTFEKQKQQKRAAWKNRVRSWLIPPSIGKGIRGILVSLAMIGGTFKLATYTPSDGPLPTLHSIQSTAPDLIPGLRLNTTLKLSNQDHVQAQDYWQGLQPTLAIVKAVAPEIYQWVQDQHTTGLIVYEAKPHGEKIANDADSETIAGYHINHKTLHLERGFWTLSDGDKATVLIHEYRHSRQSTYKGAREGMIQFLQGDPQRYESLIEDEAYQYQLEAYRALGLRPSEFVVQYLKSRHLYHLQ